MDQETFWLLMQVMFGDHYQRQKANFKLRRKGVSNKIRLKAKHKGPGARLSLKRALRDAISKYELKQRHSQHTASAFSTYTAQNHHYDSFSRPQSERPSSGLPQLDPNAPMHSQGTISRYEPNIFGKLKERIDSSPLLIKFVGDLAYSTADNAYISFLSLQRGNTRVNLAGEVVTGSRITDAGVETLINAISIPVSYSKVLQLDGLNATQFSTMFKGSFILHLKSATRGFINRMFNKIYTKRESYIIKGLLSAPKAVKKMLPSEDEVSELDSTKHVFDEPLR